MEEDVEEEAPPQEQWQITVPLKQLKFVPYIRLSLCNEPVYEPGLLY